MKLLLPLLLCLVLFVEGYAQRGGGRQAPAIGRLTGKVIDANTKEPVEYATVTLIHARDSSVTGGVTNAKGRFEISQIKLGAYHLRVSFIGYDDLIKTPIRLSPRGEGVEQDLGTLTLSPAAALIEEVEITAERDVMEMSLDRRVINVAKNIAAEGGSANDVLQNIPSVDVDIDGNVSLRGSENVTILIDGKPSGLTGAGRQAILDQIPASTIDRIEVVTNPSAKYDPDGMSGIINIITKRNGVKGMSGSITLNAGTRNKYNGTGTLNYRKGKWNLSSNYSYRYDERFRRGATLRENLFDTGIEFLDQENTGNWLRESHMVKLGADYSFSPKDVLSMSLLYNTNSFSRTEDIEYRTLDSEGALTTLSFRDNDQQSQRKSIDMNLGYVKKFKKPRQQLSLEARHSISPGENNGYYLEQLYELDYTPTDDDPFLQDNITDARTSITTLQADYVNPISRKLKYELGYKSIFRTIGTDFFSQSFDYGEAAFISDDELNNDFEYSEQVHAIYGMYTRSFGKFTAQLGLRVEQAYTDAKLITTGDNFENNYFNLFPSGFLTYQVSQNDEFQFSYSRRINRPRTRQLNPFLNVSDPLNTRQGNPFLLPEYIDAYEIGYAHNWKNITINSSIYWREIHDMIRRFNTVDENGISNLTYVNLAGGRSYGLELIVTGKVTKWWDVNVSGNLFKNEVDASNLEADLNNEGTSWRAKFTSNWNFNKDLQLQITGRYRAPFAISQGEISEVYHIDAALKKKVLKGKGSLTLRVSDIFDKRQFAVATEGDNFNQQSTRKRESRIGYLSFSYRFGSLDGKRGRGRRGNRNRGGGNGGDDLDVDQ